MADAPTERQGRTVAFDRKIFSPTAVKKAAYRHLSSFAADISLTENEIQCVLHFSEDTDSKTCERLVDEFKKEVLDQDLREKLKLETEAIRNLILAHAFSKTGLTNEQVSED